MEKYRYNDPAARYAKVNHVFLLGSDLLFLVMVIYFWIYSQSIGRSAWMLWGNVATLLLFMTANNLLYYFKKSTGVLRVVVAAEVIGLYIFYSFSTPATFLGMALMGIMGIAIAYYETKFFNLLFILCSVLYVACQVIRSNMGITAADPNGISQVVMNLAIFVMLQRIASITKVFSDHSMGAIADQKALQDQMVSEMVDISQIIKNESDKSTDLVENLVQSARLTAVNIQEITQTTETSARNLETQTHMTVSIQSALSDTKTSSDEMVTVAGSSHEQITQNQQVMQELQTQSGQITTANAQVSQAMEQLRNCASQVEASLGIILNISDQTSLLAVNASIESARAGAAGKGFAIVAKQIRQLSEETRKSTEDITQTINQLNRASQEVVGSIQQSVDAVEKQTEMIESASTLSQQLADNMSRLISSIENIDAKIGSLTDANNTMVDSISQISASIQEITSSANETNTITQTNLKNAKDTRTALTTIQKTASRLEQYIDAE